MKTTTFGEQTERGVRDSPNEMTMAEITCPEDISGEAELVGAVDVVVVKLCTIVGVADGERGMVAARESKHARMTSVWMLSCEDSMSGSTVTGGRYEGGGGRTNQIQHS